MFLVFVQNYFILIHIWRVFLGCRNSGWSYFLSVLELYWYNQCQPETLFCSCWEISYIMITGYLTAMCFFFWLHLNVYLILHVHWFTMICFILFFCKLITWICSSFLICRLIFLSTLKYFQPSYLHIFLLTDFFYCSSHFEPQIHIFSTFSQIPIYSLFWGFPMIFFSVVESGIFSWTIFQFFSFLCWRQNTQPMKEMIVLRLWGKEDTH